MQSEIVETAMRPGAVRAVAEGHEHSQEEVQRNGANSSESNVGREVEDCDAHWQ